MNRLALRCKLHTGILYSRLMENLFRITLELWLNYLISSLQLEMLLVRKCICLLVFLNLSFDCTWSQWKYTKNGNGTKRLLYAERKQKKTMQVLTFWLNSNNVSTWSYSDITSVVDLATLRDFVEVETIKWDYSTSPNKRLVPLKVKMLSAVLTVSTGLVARTTRHDKLSWKKQHGL